MAIDEAEAQRLKEKGNLYFMKQDYEKAESLYSQAIVFNPTNPIFYTNRAMTRLKLSRYEDAIEDCRYSMDLDPEAIKPYFYLAQAYMEIGQYDEAVENAIAASERCFDKKDNKSLKAVSEIVRKGRAKRWEAKEKKRIRELKESEMLLQRLIEEERERDEKEAEGDEVGLKEVRLEAEERLRMLRELVERARKDGEREQVVPDWALDDISYEIMTDPVVTLSGVSYERSSILAHLELSKTDPISRVPMTEADLRPNLKLRQACEEFLDKNGWAADW